MMCTFFGFNYKTYKRKSLILNIFFTFLTLSPVLSLAQEVSVKTEYSNIPDSLKKVVISAGTFENFRSRIFNAIRKRNFNEGKLNQAGIDNIKQEAFKRKGIIQSTEILKFDLNSDLKIEKDEIVSDITQNDEGYKGAYNQEGYLKGRIKKYMVLDSDKDGVLSLAETRMLNSGFLRLETYEEEREQESILFLEYMLAQDPNKDGVIGDEELDKISLSIFTAIDVDKDRIVSSDEVNGYQKFIEEEKKLGQDCKFKGVEFDKNMIVYAAGDYSGRPLEEQTVSGITATQFDVIVNETKAPIALILGSYENAIWNIKTTPKTTISAIVVGGYYSQFIAGVDNSIPVLKGIFEPKSECDYFYVNEREPETISNISKLSKIIFGKNVKMLYLPEPEEKGKIIIGDRDYDPETLVFAKDNQPESYFLKTTKYSGEKGIKYALENGYLRMATKEEINKWNMARVKIDLRIYEALPLEVQQEMDYRLIYSYNENPEEYSPPLILLSEAYVILTDNFSLPADIHANYLVPEGVKMPVGKIDKAVLYDMNTMQCIGRSGDRYTLSFLKEKFGINNLPNKQ